MMHNHQQTNYGTNAMAVERPMDSSYMQPGYSDAPPSSPLDDKFAALEKRVAMLLDQAADLERRLQPVMVPPSPQDACDNGARPGQATPLLQTLQSLDEQLEWVARRFAGIHNRIVL